ncbi:MAG: hypothetical protein U0359_00225 [Byssovorax sp.]
MTTSSGWAAPSNNDNYDDGGDDNYPKKGEEMDAVNRWKRPGWDRQK